ncbi:DUF1819 family protein [Endozoicomonas gorgoniicola]|uniref:DUF1819 family protein n=1 Tax=Endozoicomonas gorgoniicola TaxID=1234144 RepID=A0ABT3MU23_9GAMM|nr:DUF1819 family protein [Endozoicomonas gorgoniicola]MCW7552865.1 DUF1819 family protein [Endozoicomonas gorgoniicola]
MNQKYSADLASVSLKLTEARAVARLMLEKVSGQQWQQAIQRDNVLMLGNPATAKRHANALRSRLATLDDRGLVMVSQGNHAVALQILLAATLKYSSILRDFIELLIKPQVALGNLELPRHRWRGFLESCYARDPEMKPWADSTVARIGTAVFSILQESGYINDTRKPVLQPVLIEHSVGEYLKKQGDEAILRTMKVFES